MPCGRAASRTHAHESAYTKQYEARSQHTSSANKLDISSAVVLPLITYIVALVQEALQLVCVPYSEVDVLSNMSKALSDGPVTRLPFQ